MNKTLVHTLAVAVILIASISIGTSYGDLEKSSTIMVNISPKTIVLGADGSWITAHTDIALSSVNTSSLTLNGVPVAWATSDAHGNLVAKFNRVDIESVISPPGAILTLAGVTNDGVSFSGSDEVVVREQCKR